MFFGCQGVCRAREFRGAEIRGQLGCGTCVGRSWPDYGIPNRCTPWVRSLALPTARSGPKVPQLRHRDPRTGAPAGRRKAPALLRHPALL